MYTHEEVQKMCQDLGLPVLEHSPYVPKINPDYRFPAEGLQVLLGFFYTGKLALKIIGPQGCGKSELVKQFHAAMNWPLLQPQCGPQTDEADLRGQILPDENGGFKFVPGHLVNAMSWGCSVFLDEYNLMRSSVTTALNPILDGAKLDIPETGQCIHPQEGFRIFVCENPNDKALGFHGRNAEDASNLERFITYKMGYPEDMELATIKGILEQEFDSSVSAGIADCMHSLAKKIRSLYMGNVDQGDALEATMSTRTLISWAMLMVNPIFKGMDTPALATLDLAFLNAHSTEFATQVRQFARDIFGN